MRACARARVIALSLDVCARELRRSRTVAALTWARGGCSYKEPGELTISMLEGKADKKKEELDNDSSDEEEDFSRGAKPKARKQRRVSGGHGGSPAPRAQGSKPARHSIDGSESLLGACIPILHPYLSRCARRAQSLQTSAGLGGIDASAQAGHVQRRERVWLRLLALLLQGQQLPTQCAACAPRTLTLMHGALAAEIIIHKPSAIAMTVKQWWGDYDKNPSAAVAKLTNMMIEVPFPPHAVFLHCFCCACMCRHS